jgi:ribosomal protein S18 acetylase RimI-like enzyme
MKIQTYSPEYEKEVIKLWEKCNLTRPWNNPKLDIERILKVYPGLFLIGLIDNTVIATVMGGYDGHRGWVYYLGVLSEYRRRGYGRMMMEAVTEKLLEIGCPKINIQVRGDNSEAIGFYESIGYSHEDRISMARRLVED